MSHLFMGCWTFTEMSQSTRMLSRAGVNASVRNSPTSLPRKPVATSRAVGSAVERNRLRRRLRVVFTDLAAQRPELVPPGDYLLAIRRARFSNEEAKQWRVTALETLAADQ